MQKERDWWRKWQEGIMTPTLHRLVFLDESGVNTNLTRRYGRAFVKERVKDCVPLNKTKNTTILSSMRLDGSVAYTTYSGGTTGDKFIGYLKETLIPTLRPWDIVVMDNLRTHHIDEVRRLLSEAGVMLMYLPAYSPDLNPIEMMWSKVKAILRKAKGRTEETLIAAIKEA
ncbi:MAG: IS630 family transposase, partial [Abditibacteriota bacterium]|nr:IS630 family transposase [Abditibacteriota bacterium]